ncbi:ubiquinone biosynthesis protein [Desulfitispora alkaliphila]|uniref:ABC1 kinase family protein n=1 Tax=Desulfitispora alkaliphila TaxID=622674 RepID=UPI003D1C8656
MLQKRYRNLSRYKEIGNILVKHGFGYTLDTFGLSDLFPNKQRTVSKDSEKKMPVRIKNVLQDLGPTFVKFGQIMSTRMDLLPQEYIEELEKLQDDVPVLPQEQVRSVLESELGDKVENIFLDFKWKPIASASIGQVHWGMLENGYQVAIKVQRPGMKEKMESDLEILWDIVQLIDKKAEWAKNYNLLEVVDQLSYSLRAEVDYLLEARNMDRFTENFKDDSTVIIPNVIWEYTTNKVLVMEYIDSIKISKISSSEQIGSNSPDIIANRLVQSMFRQVFIFGFFHSDPHPGNLGVVDNKVVFMDFGQVGKIDEWAQSKYTDLLLAMVRQDINTMVNILLDFGIASRSINKKDLKNDLSKFRSKYYRTALEEIEMKQVLNDLVNIINKNQLKLPADFGLIMKAIITVEGIVKNLNSNLSVVEMAEPMTKDLFKKRYNAKYIRRQLVNSAYDLTQSMISIPRQLQSVFTLIEDGELRVKIEHKKLVPLLKQLNIISNRIALSIVLASIIIGSSLIARRTEDSFILQILIPEIGFVVAFVLGLWLIISILRSGRY